ncbi:MAG: ribose 5-phosphate isomerase B [Vicinamibacterales bacterium]
MRIAVGADHAGFGLKEEVKRILERLGAQYEDFGTMSQDAVDYPDVAGRVARAVSDGSFDLGVLVCGTGTGMAMAANKVPGIRAASVNTAELARLSRSHNDANILALGGRFTSPAAAEQIVRAFIETPFEGGRHERRIQKIRALERPSGSNL